MSHIVEALNGLSADTQIILAMAVFALVLLIATSRRAARNFCDILDALRRLIDAKRGLITPERKPQNTPSGKENTTQPT